MQLNVSRLLTTHIMPAGNGLPELEISPIDPTSWVQSQADARQPAAAADDDPRVEAMRKAGMDAIKTGKLGGIGDAISSGVDAVIHPYDTITGKLAESARGIVIFSIMLLLGAGLILLGGWQLTKD